MLRRSMIFAGALMLSVACGLMVVSGCGGDGVAPQDEFPATTQDLANQGGTVAYAMVNLAPEILDFSPAKLDPANPETKQDEAYPLVLTGDVRGTVLLMFKRLGEIVAYDEDPDWAWLFTIPDEPLVGGEDDLIRMALELVADPLTPTTALVNGGGTVWFGGFERTFTVTDLAVVLTGPPTGGTIVYTDDEHVITVTFDGSDYAAIDVDGLPFELNLNTGEVVAMR